MKPHYRPAGFGLEGVGLAAAALVLTPGVALAHGAHIQSRLADAIEIRATYDTGEPMSDAQVQVFAPHEPQTPVITSATDEEGKFVFVPATPGSWEVSVRQAGHGDIAVIPVTEAGAIAADFTNDSGLSLLQRIVVAGAITWGCVGTALYFMKGKR